MAHIVFIHGIDNKPDPEHLLTQWREVLATRGGIDLARERITSCMVYWADVLYAKPRVEMVDEVVEPSDERADPAIVAELAAALSGSPAEAAFVAGLCGKFGAVCLRAAAETPPQERELPERVPLPWLIKEPLMAKYLRDAHHYLFNADFSPRPGVRFRVRDEIRQRFVAALSDRGHTTPPCVVVSHSMGTVIAYDCLLRVPNCAAIDGLMTIGSPLGLDEIQDQLQPGWTRRNGFPAARLLGSWVNVFDPLDPVDGFDPRLADDYQQNGRQVIRDIEQSNWGMWRHDIAKYLAGSPLRTALRGQLGLPIVAPSTVSTRLATIETTAATKPRSRTQNAPVVTYHTVASLLGLTGPATEGVAVAAADGAWVSVEEAAEAAVADQRRRTALVSGLIEALGELAHESAENGMQVLNSPRHQLASILQSVVAEHRQVADAAGPALELAFDKRDRKEVLKEFFRRACCIEKHDQLRPRSAKPDKLADIARLFLVGDFGTGLYGAPVIASTIARGEPFDVVMHLGDIYYSGQRDEVNDRFLKIWPQSAGTISRNINGNHDMYSGGFGYFDVSLDAFEQDASYFALQNRHWLLVGLDTAYKDNNLSKKQLDWLDDVIAGTDNRRIILFSHHPLFSNFKEQGAKLAEKLHDLLHSGQVAAWYWGHEHRCIIYDRHPIYRLFGRCLGHGGMPYTRDKVADMHVESAVDDFLWRRPTEPRMLPALYLDGPNPYIDEEPEKYGPHGYMTLELNGPRANETVCDATGSVLFEHTIK